MFLPVGYVVVVVTTRPKGTGRVRSKRPANGQTEAGYTCSCGERWRRTKLRNERTAARTESTRERARRTKKLHSKAEIVTASVNYRFMQQWHRRSPTTLTPAHPSRGTEKQHSSRPRDRLHPRGERTKSETPMCLRARAVNLLCECVGSGRVGREGG